MTAADLIADLEARGVILVAHGESVHFRAPVGVLTADDRSRLAGLKPQVLALLQRRAPYRRTTTGPAPLSYAQQRLWLLESLAPGMGAHNNAIAIPIDGALGAPTLARSLEAVVQRHASLRTRSEVIHGEPMQIVGD